MINSIAINSSHDTLTSLCKGPTKHPTIQLDVSSLARGGKSNMSLAFMGVSHQVWIYSRTSRLP